MSWQTAIAVDSYRVNSEDRAAVLSTPFGFLLIVADGVGGRSGGAAAADFILRETKALGMRLDCAPSSRELAQFLFTTDNEMSGTNEGGETTAMVIAIADLYISGAANRGLVSVVDR